MKRNAFILLLLLLLFSCGEISYAQYNTVVKRIYSKEVRDSFDIYISAPVNNTDKDQYDLVYYCDANLKSGTLLRHMIEENLQLSKEKRLIFVGIGHIGNYHVLRRRDFILPAINKTDTVSSSADYGHIREFYRFLKLELAPSLEQQFHSSGIRTIIGHSLGGLFAIYCLFQNDGFFQNFMALSPALWIDKYSVYRFNRINGAIISSSNLYLSAGSKETMNRILTGTGQLNCFLNKQRYGNLRIKYEVHPGKTHNSQVSESLKYILANI